MQVVGVMVAVAGSAGAGVAVGGQAREVEPPKVTVANKVSNAVPVSAVVTRMPAVQLEPGTRIELSAETIADIKDNLTVKMARPEWEYRELRVATSPGNYASIIGPLGQAGAQGWETTGLTFSDAGATVMILKRQK
jgi:hypothetical protein